ncbi:MAG: glycosyltransferase family 4 protein [archaeon]|nr:glycosyltransferase family 4 protein [archaeon]
MKIVQLAPNVLNLNKDMKYGGIERLIIQLDKQFELIGHQHSIIVPAGDNSTQNNLTTLPESYWNSTTRDEKFKRADQRIFNDIAHLAKAIEFINQGDFDIVHDHTGKLFPFKKSLNKPLLTTLHGPSDWFWDKNLYKDLFKRAFFNAISNSQKQDYDFLRVDYVVYNGLDLNSFPFSKQKSNYLFTLGQITNHKGQHIAIEVSKKTGLDLIIAGKISDDPTDPEDRDYFENQIRPNLNQKIKFIGELNDSEKKPYYRDAKCFLMPIDCKEAFGLVMIESMACGTPVIAFNKGAVPELVIPGITGYIAKDTKEMIEYIGKVGEIDPEKCRDYALKHFDISVIAKSYIQVYKDVIRRFEK